MKKNNLIFTHKVLKAIADSIIKIFIPLYILKQTNELWLALGYLAIYSTFVILGNLCFKKLIQKFGVVAIMLHFIPIIATEAILLFCELNIFTLLVCALLMSVSQSLYSVPLNLIFTFGDKDTNVAKFQIASNVGKLGFILISGFVLSSTISNSFLIMCIASVLFYVAGVVPLLFAYKLLKENYEKTIGTSQIKHADKTYKKFVWFHVSFGTFQACLDNCLPLYLFVNNLSFQAVTIIIAIIELCKIMANYLAKVLVKHNKQKLSCIISCSVFLVCVVCLLIFKIPALLYVFSCLCSISFPLTFVPMFKKYCNYLTETSNVFDGMIYRDVYIFSFRPLLYCSYILGFSLYACFGVGIISMFAMFISEMKLLENKNMIENIDNWKGEKLWNCM